MLLECRNMAKRFGNLRAVADVSLALRQGEILALVGPNGAGKTTLLDLLTGAQQSDTGEIHMDGEAVRVPALKEMARRGFLRTWQRPRYVADLTVLENMLIEFPHQIGERWTGALRRAKWGSQELALSEIAHGVLQRLGLDEFAEKPARELSLGQVKLLTLGMVLVSGPRIVGLDEPVAGVATPLRNTIVGVLEERRMDMGTILIEHDLAFVRKLADRVLLMAEGGIILEGPPDEVLDSDVALRIYVGTKRTDD
uniref:Branched-chain amino acid transport system ATP-binding protein n=1 Tax=Candidatus Kentrum sp. TC TaxID=2126339 RepID=A0A450YVK7_9GAMM|nr:MAG: branched-chain amino acid transport system ATP-binding protein [Candidatus Kentron sp. TC]